MKPNATAAMFHEAAEFLQGITAKDAVIIVFNNDADGICSCVPVLQYIRAKGCRPLIISQPMPPEDALLRKIQTTVPTKIIFLDMAIDQDATFMKKLGSLCDLLIIDHHQVSKNLNGPGVVHCNPRIQQPGIYQSTSYLVYRILSRIADARPALWVAAVGMIADYNLDDSQDVVSEIRHTYKVAEPKLYDSHFGRLADMIGSAKATKRLSMEELVELFARIEDPFDFEQVQNADRLLFAYRETEHELARLRGTFTTLTEQHGDVIFYPFSSPFNLRSTVSTMLSERHRDKIILVYEKVTSWIDVSARNQGKQYNVGNLLKEAAQGLKATGGGHEAAAGAKVAEKDWPEFRERVVALARSQKK